jgi:aspartyl-tRNA(Asn)/glutamyl-tRNA(Gln) amidotransferase subunit A
MTSQTSVVGVLTTTVTDSARCLDVQAGPDPTDRTSLPPAGIVYEDVIETLDVTGLRARWSLDLGFVEHVDPEVAELARAGAEILADAAGLRFDEEPVQLADATRVWLQSGALSTWAMEGVKERWPDRAAELMGFTRKGLESGAQLTAVQLGRIARRRFEFEKEAAALFSAVDVVLTPTTAVPAFAAAGPPPGGAMATPFTMLGNLTGCPSTTVPCGVSSDGLPIGLMITARHHRDDVALRLARLFEQMSPWPRFAPGAPASL